MRTSDRKRASASRVHAALGRRIQREKRCQLNEIELDRGSIQNQLQFSKIVLPHAHPTDLLIRSIRVDLLQLLLQLRRCAD
jgi:hypothetical protein